VDDPQEGARPVDDLARRAALMHGAKMVASGCKK